MRNPPLMCLKGRSLTLSLRAMERLENFLRVRFRWHSTRTNLEGWELPKRNFWPSSSLAQAHWRDLRAKKKSRARKNPCKKLFKMRQRPWFPPRATAATSKSRQRPSSMTRSLPVGLNPKSMFQLQPLFPISNHFTCSLKSCLLRSP